MSETDREKFKRLAEQRTNKIIKTLRLLGNLSNKSNYSYDKSDIDKIFSAINSELRACKSRFGESAEKTEGEFKLD